MEKASTHRYNLMLEAFGWYGTAAIVLAYALASFGILPPDTVLSQAINLTGAIGIIAISWYKRVYQSVALNIIWAAIAIIAILRILVF